MSPTLPFPRVIDRLPENLPIDRAESEWLLSLLSADELRYIFDGHTAHVED
ncbi:hypothetical protein ACFSC3_12890 [Sphingomonas floccifaciens]|uniref:Uncharacterized protein n=1 Tax=Sphingomonas floccifaciens TaxID=1844115 RepID=A0ABW4NF69_9SPHN